MVEFTTIWDAQEYVAEALGDLAPEMDVEAIAEAVTGWEDGKLVLTKDGEEFWEEVNSRL